MIRLYSEERWSLKDIGLRFGCGLECVRQFLIRHGVEMNPKGANLTKRGPRRSGGPIISRLAGHEAEIVRLYSEGGLSMGEIAERFGMHRTSTSRLAGILRAAGIEPRPRNQHGLHGPLPKTVSVSRPKPDPKKHRRERRQCLMCRKGFSSSWAGERVCRACKGSEAWRGASIDV